MLELAQQIFEWDGETGLENFGAAVKEDLFKIMGCSGEIIVDAGEFFFVFCLDENAVELIEEIVAGGSVHVPRWRQGFAGGENFFHEDAGRAQEFCEAAKVLSGVPESVGVIDAQGHFGLAAKRSKQGVGGAEDFGFLNVEADEFVDVKETAVIDFFVGEFPVAETVMLLTKNDIERGAGVCVFIDRKTMLVIGNPEAFFFANKFDFAGGQGGWVILSQDGDGDAVWSLGIIEIKVVGIRGSGAVLQDVEPPFIFNAGFHVIWNHVK